MCVNQSTLSFPKLDDRKKMRKPLYWKVKTMVSVDVPLIFPDIFYGRLRLATLTAGHERALHSSLDAGPYREKCLGPEISPIQHVLLYLAQCDSY